MSKNVVTVVCQNPAHETRTVKLLSFRGLPNDDGSMRWVEMRNRSRSAKPRRNQSSHRDDWALSDEAVERSQHASPVMPESYNKVVFECPLCSVAFSTSDAARMDATLTALFRHAVTEIPLTMLRDAYSR